jgi:hypothetical protein
MLKLEGTQEYEWVACLIGKTLGLPVQDAVILNPSISNSRNADGKLTSRVVDEHGNLGRYINNDDTLVQITLFTSDKVSLVHASEVFSDDAGGQGHLCYFYDRLPNDKMKRDFERVLILNWLISNHDMHAENYGCLYSTETFEIIGIAPSFDHNSALFNGAEPDWDFSEIIAPNIHHHSDVINKIESGYLDAVLEEVKDWLSPEQKDCVRNVGENLTKLFREKTKVTTQAQ